MQRWNIFKRWNLYQRYIFIIDCSIRSKQIKKGYSDLILKEYNIIKPYIPTVAHRILDIGAGVGGIDVALFKHYEKSHNVKLYLLDKTYIDKKIHYGLKEKAAFYNSLEITRDLLSLNGVPERNIHLQNANDENKIEGGPFDLVISLISWGFHYPISTYLEQVYNRLNDGGTTILDIRKGTDAISEIRTKYSKIKVIYEGDKHQRLCLIKQ